MNKHVLKIEISRASAKTAAIFMLLLLNSPLAFSEEPAKNQDLPNGVSIR
ncbi:MAG: hypothetical protein PHY16_03610 [Methylobacter sp.]|nr:hypothetical protein [Methylobacter sp.]